MKRTVLGAAFLMIVAAGCNCGGGGSTWDCSKPYVACGGNLVGTWKYVSACGSYLGDAGTSFSCSSDGGMETLTSSSSSIDETVNFKSDGTYTFQLGHITSTSVVNLPKACIPPSTTSCDALHKFPDGGSYYTNSDGGSSGITEACSGDLTQGCTCTLTYDFNLSDGGLSGTYTTSGNNLTLGTSTMSTGTYCVSGSNLLVGVNTGDAGLATSPAGYSVFAKQ